MARDMHAPLRARPDEPASRIWPPAHASPPTSASRRPTSLRAARDFTKHFDEWHTAARPPHALSPDRSSSSRRDALTPHPTRRSPPPDAPTESPRTAVDFFQPSATALSYVIKHSTTYDRTPSLPSGAWPRPSHALRHERRHWATSPCTCSQRGTSAVRAGTTASSHKSTQLMPEFSAADHDTETHRTPLALSTADGGDNAPPRLRRTRRPRPRSSMRCMRAAPHS